MQNFEVQYAVRTPGAGNGNPFISFPGGRQDAERTATGVVAAGGRAEVVARVVIAGDWTRADVVEETIAAHLRSERALLVRALPGTPESA